MKQFLFDTIFGTAVVFLFLCFLLFVLPFLVGNRDTHLLPEGNSRATIEEVRENSRPGDLLGVSSLSLHNQVVRIFTRSTWSHVAMIVMNESGEKYVVEIHYKGFIQTPLHEWLLKKKHRKVVWCQISSGANVNDKLGSSLKKKILLNSNYYSWLTGRFSLPKDKINNTELKDEQYCSEFIAYLLQKMNVIDLDKPASFYSPGELINSNFKLKFPHWQFYYPGRLISFT